MPLDIKDGAGVSKTLKTTESGSDLVPHHVIESGTVTNLSQLAGVAIAMGTGVRSAGTQRVTIATDDSVAVTGTFWQATQPVSLASTTITGTVAATQSGTWTVTGTGGTFPVTDSGGSLTIDAPVGTPAFVRLSDGTSPISTLPVSLASTTITGTVAVTGTFWQATQPVSLASVPSHPVTNAGTFAVQATQSGTWTVTGTGGTFPVTDSGGSLTVDGTVAATQSGTWNVTISAALPSGSNNIGDVDVLSLPALAAGTNTVGDVGIIGRTSGGLTLSRTLSAASTNATSVKASAGQVFWIYCTNTNAAVRYLKLYNKASAPTVGSDTPVATLAIPGNTAGAGFHLQSPLGLTFGTGIAFAITTGVADADTGAVAANEVVVNLGYK